MPQLVLLFGLPRSGTTWIGKILDSHPGVAYRHEPDSVVDMGLPLFPDPPWAPEDLEKAQRFAEGLASFSNPHVVGKRPFFPKEFQPPGMHRLLQAVALGAKAAGRLGLRIERLPMAAWRADQATRLVWKSIESLGRLSLLKAALPTARSVHILRHPCGYVASVLRGESQQRFGSSVPSWEDWGIFRMLLDTGTGRNSGVHLEQLEEMNPWQRLAWRWRTVNDKILEELHDAKAHRILIYEQLCRDPAAETARLLEHCGLALHRQTSDFLERSTRGGERADYYSVIRNPWTSAWAWQKRLEPGQIDQILEIVADSPSWRYYLEAGLDRLPAQMRA